MLHVAVRAQDQHQPRLPGREAHQVCRGEAVQPAQAVGTGDLEDVAMAEVDDPDASHEVPLLGQRVAVVPGNGLVDRSGWGRDGAQGAHA